MRALRGTPTHDSSDVRVMLERGTATLFVQARETIEAMAVTEFLDFPRGRWLHFFLVGARNDTPLSVKAFDPVMKTFATQNGCRGYQFSGAREGWLRKIPPDRIEGVCARYTF